MIREDGRRVLLALTIGAQESEASWADLLQKLTERGLSGVKRVIADDQAGWKAAVRSHLPDARLQRCVVHFQRSTIGLDWIHGEIKRRTRAVPVRGAASL